MSMLQGNRVQRVVLAVLLAFAPGALAQDEAPAAGGAESQPVAAPVVEVPVAPEAEGAPAPVIETPSPDPRVDALAAEVRRIKEELGIGPVTYESFSGLGPAASKVYFTPKGLSIGGYGEGFYAYDPAPGGVSTTDVLRFILYAGYRFTDKIVLNSEIEFEHAHSSKQGEVAVEFMYLDFQLSQALGIRAGNVLVPMGFTNEIHEPVFFRGVQRPELERNLLPSTWNENGVGVYGQVGRLRYRGYLLNGLQAFSNQKCVTDDKGTQATSDDVKLCNNGNSGFSAGSWIRNGRPRGSKALAENFAGVARVDYEQDRFLVGASAYFGRAGQGKVIAGEVVEGEVAIAEAHATFDWKGFSARGLFVVGSLGDAEVISTAQRSVVGSQVMGGYGEVAYDVFSVLRPGGDESLTPFVRYEYMNLHQAVGPSQRADPSRATNVLTAGLGYRPISNVIIKGDYQRRWTTAGTTNEALTLGLGFVF